MTSTRAPNRVHSLRPRWAALVCPRFPPTVPAHLALRAGARMKSGRRGVVLGSRAFQEGAPCQANGHAEMQLKTTCNESAASVACALSGLARVKSPECWAVRPKGALAWGVLDSAGRRALP